MASNLDIEVLKDTFNKNLESALHDSFNEILETFLKKYPENVDYAAGLNLYVGNFDGEIKVAAFAGSFENDFLGFLSPEELPKTIDIWQKFIYLVCPYSAFAPPQEIFAVYKMFTQVFDVNFSQSPISENVDPDCKIKEWVSQWFEEENILNF